MPKNSLPKKGGIGKLKPMSPRPKYETLPYMERNTRPNPLQRDAMRKKLGGMNGPGTPNPNESKKKIKPVTYRGKVEDFKKEQQRYQGYQGKRK